MKKILNKSPEIILIIGAIIILGAIYIWAPVCTNFLELKTGKLVHMHCHYSAITASMFALVMLALVLDSLLLKKKNIIAPIVIGILLFILIGNSGLGIGICMMATMKCHTTAPWLYTASALSIVSGIIAYFQNRKETKTPTQLDY